MLYTKLKNLDSLIQSYIENGLISGSSIKLIHKNEVCYQKEFGLADLDKGTPVCKNTIFRMHSMTKPVTAVAAMILYERGELDLLSPVSDYLEGFKNQKVLTEDGLSEAAREVTIQDLLNMTSGVVYPDENFEAGRHMAKLFSEVEAAYHKGNSVATLDFCNRIGRMPLEFQPGERWRYGASADILGAVIEIISGCKYSQFLKDEIFTPLGMFDTAFYVPEEKLARFAKIYEYNTDQKKLELFTGDFLALFDYMAPPAFESGGAGLVSTIEDYSKFTSMLINGGTNNGSSIIGRKSVGFLSMPQLSEKQLITYDWDSQYGYNYGNLVRTMVEPAKAYSNGTVGEFGWDGWSGSYFFIDPKEELVFIFMVQRCGGPGHDFIRKLRNIIYGALE